MRGIVFDIQRFSIHDGPGIRTTVFLKGCNLNCFWCHNPESINPYSEIEYFPEKCIGCGKCIEVCPENAHQIKDGQKIFNRELCQRCSRCVEQCYAEALTMVGKEMTVEEVMEEVVKDQPFYENSGGGITFSGGECLLQPDFVKVLLEESKKRELHTTIDTTGNIPWSILSQIIPDTDLFLYDIKVMNEEKHKQVTGVSNKRILGNLKKLVNEDVDIWIRIPVIPGVNDDVEEMQKICGFITDILQSKIKLVKLLPFHKLGEGKYRSLSRELNDRLEELEPPEEEWLEELGKVFKEQGVKVKDG